MQGQKALLHFWRCSRSPLSRGNPGREERRGKPPTSIRPHRVVPKGSAPELEPCIAVLVPVWLWDVQDPHREADTCPGLGAPTAPGEHPPQCCCSPPIPTAAPRTARSCCPPAWTPSSSNAERDAALWGRVRPEVSPHPHTPHGRSRPCGPIPPLSPCWRCPTWRCSASGLTPTRPRAPRGCDNPR